MTRKDSKYTVDEVINALSKKKDCRVVVIKEDDILYKAVFIKNEFAKDHENDLGNGSLGKIDFLCTHKGFKRIYTDELPVFAKGKWRWHKKPTYTWAR